MGDEVEGYLRNPAALGDLEADWGDGEPDWSTANIIRLLRSRSCAPGVLWVGQEWGDDHGHTDCWVHGLAAARLEALEQELSELRAAVEPPAAEPGPDAPFCSSSVVRDHESFGCLERVGHVLPHRGPVVPPPCEGCGGLDTHDAEDCAFVDLREDDHPVSLEVTWGDDGVVVLVDRDEVPY